MLKLILSILLSFSFITGVTGDKKKKKPVTKTECDTLLDSNIQTGEFPYDAYWFNYYNYNHVDYRDHNYETQYGAPLSAFNDNVYLYCQPDTTSTKLDTFSFNEFISFQKLEHVYYNQGKTWLKISGDKKGFMLLNDISDPKRTYYLGHDYSKRLRLGFVQVTDSNGTYDMVAAKLFSKQDNKVLSTNIIGHYISTFHFDVTPYTPIDDNGVFRYSSSMESCPGFTYTAFYTLSGYELVKLADGNSEGEGSYYSHDIIYIPTYTDYKKTKIVLAPEGNIGGHWDSLPYPKDIGVPIENLIVKFSEAADADTGWFSPTDHIYEKIKAYDDGDNNDENDEFLYVHKRDTLYYEYKDGKVIPINYPKKK